MNATPVELLTTADVADLLGVSSQRVRQLVKTRSDFPRPYASSHGVRRAVGTRYWSRVDVERWNDHADRSPGRPYDVQGRLRS